MRRASAHSEHISFGAQYPAHSRRYRRFTDTLTGIAARLAVNRGSAHPSFQGLSPLPLRQLAWRTLILIVAPHHSAYGPDEVFVGCAFGRRARRCRAEGLFASAVVPEGIPPRAALARRTLWLVKRSSLVVLFPERPADRQWGPGSRHVFRSSLYHLKPLFVVASRPPTAPAYCRVVASDLFATVDGYWVVPHTFRDGFCDDEY